MGLDISAYEKATLVKAISLKEWNAGACDECDGAATFLYKDHPSRTQNDDLTEGVYETSGECHGFRAGSYGGYNNWRSLLARLVGTTDEAIWKGGEAPAFRELIHFSDCEGFIGPKTSAKLARDFAEWQARAETFAAAMADGSEGSYWIGKYREWRRAFEIAAKGGAVKFH